MQRTLAIVPLAASLLALSAAAQTGRTMKLMAPVVLGQTASIVMEYPPSIAGHQFAMAMCSPTHPGALPISIPGVAEGVLRLDPLAYGVLGIGVLDASGQSPALTFLVPNDPLLVGASFDVQGADIDGAGLITLTDNDLEIEVAAPPLASLNMVPISAGTFLMGSLAGLLNEQPVHSVTITRPFWIGRFEVTQAEYLAVMGSNPSLHQGASYPTSASLPVEQVTWSNAVAYCDALTLQESLAGRLPAGYEYRLPTEAEWEFCCRAGTATEWNVGTSLSCSHANFYPCVGQTSIVGSYPANAWGLHDMHGNVSELCLDHVAGYHSAATIDPFVRAGPGRIVRGGSWNWFGSYYCRSAYRDSDAPGLWNRFIGFRVVCAPIIRPSFRMGLVAIAPGTFQMGSVAGAANEQPVHSVAITRPFWMGRSEVTQAEYQAVMGSNPSFFQVPSFPNNASRPVENVSWTSAVAYCDALTAQETAAGRLASGYEYRLPTEAEWEYCCRAGTTTEWNVGTSLSCAQANCEYCFGETSIVGSYPSNAWWLHDMHGNVWEWCLDNWDGGTNYPAGLASDPFVESGFFQVIRGGGYFTNPSGCRSAQRGGFAPGFLHIFIGFRVVCAPILP